VQVLLTFVAVAVSLVFFKAESLQQALLVTAALAGLGGPLDIVGPVYLPETVRVAVGLFIVWALPNTEQWVGLAALRNRSRSAVRAQALGQAVPRSPATAAPAVPPSGAQDPAPAQRWRTLAAWSARLQWSPGLLHGYILGAALCLVLLRAFGAPPVEFLYFQF